MQSIQTAFEWLVQHQEQMADDLEQLCNINSGSDSVSGLERAANWLVDYFAPLERPCSRIALPTFQQMDDQGVMVTQQTGAALRWDLHPTRAKLFPSVLLSIHYDTVYGPRSDFQSCHRYEAQRNDGTTEHRMRGPGVIDAKGGIVVLRWAVLAAKQFLDLSRINISILLTPDEEIGSPSTSNLWKQVADQFDFAMLYEPTLADGSLVSQRKGTGTIIFVVRGKSAHSGRNFQEGRNAVVHACKIATALDALNGLRQDVTINVGRIRGGDAVNVVPDLAVLRVNVRVSSPDDQVWIESQVQQVVQEYQATDSGYQVELHGGINSAPKIVDASTQRWMEIVQEAGSRISEKIRWKPSGGASDGNKLARLGLSNIDTFGPEGDLLHSDQEWVRISSLPRKAALSVAVIQEILSDACKKPSRAFSSGD